ncbi:hypothetical protein VTP01DRAFT_4070 [Rhizomucor pusillus]|uniref:uncharacterized protein n=1 Tax=Rhizomucor pusillus TaxID=4840 RepID=UPI00374325DC
MAVSLLAYVVTFFLFLCNYALTITALIIPKWLSFVAPMPLYMETDYGLFRLCRSFNRDCRPFPSEDQGDCGEDGFCELWRAAGAGMVLATILGGLTLIALLGTMCSNARKRGKAWTTLAGMFVLHAIPQAVAMGIIAYLFNTSATFYVGTRYNVSFIVCTISWCISIFLAAVLCLVAILSPPEYAYQPIN